MFGRGAEDARACFQPAPRRRREPGERPGQGLEALLAQQAAVGPLLRLAHPLDPLRRDARPEQLAQDLVVALAEGVGEVARPDRAALRGQRVPPGDPVVAGRVDERPVEVPQHAARALPTATLIRRG